MASGMRYVIDGCMLLHRIAWTIGSLSKDIYASYASFLSTYTSCTILNVFDGYHCYSSKDMVHKIRERNGEILTALTLHQSSLLH